MKLVIDIPKCLYDMAHTSNNVNLFRRIAGSICSTIANGTPLDKIRIEIKDQIDYHDDEHRKYDSEEEFGISLGLELALAIINKEVSDADSD